MEINVNNKDLIKLLSSSKKLIKKFGDQNARKIILRLNQIKATPNFELLLLHKVGRCHPLTGDRKGTYALDLQHPKRLIIEPVFENGSTLIKEVTIVDILNVEDYHG